MNEDVLDKVLTKINNIINAKDDNEDDMYPPKLLEGLLNPRCWDENTSIYTTWLGTEVKTVFSGYDPKIKSFTELEIYYKNNRICTLDSGDTDYSDYINTLLQQIKNRLNPECKDTLDSFLRRKF